MLRNHFFEAFSTEAFYQAQQYAIDTLINRIFNDIPVQEMQQIQQTLDQAF